MEWCIVRINVTILVNVINKCERTMKNEKELHLSWSDLSIYTGIKDVNDFRLVIKQACTKYPYRLKLIPQSFDPLNNPGIIIDAKKLSINKDVKVLTVGGIIIDPLNTHLNRSLEDRLITYDYYEKHKDDHQKLRDLVSFVSGKFISPDQIIKLVLMDTNNTFIDLSFEYEKENEGFVAHASEAGAIQEYPLLASIHLQNPEKYICVASQQGGTRDFEEWLRYKVLHSEEELQEWIKKKSPAEDYMKNFHFEST